MNQISTLPEENTFFIDSVVDLLLTQKITNIKVLKLDSDQFHDSVIICTANSLVQMSAVIKNIRKNKKLPPFSRLIALIVSANLRQDSFRAAQEIKKRLISISELEVLGPVDSPIFRAKKKYRTRLLLRSLGSSLIQKKVGKILENLRISKKIKLTVDVDPINFS